MVSKKLLYYVYCHCPGELTILLVCVHEVCAGRCFRLVDREAKPSWDGDGRVGGQAILCLLCNLKCHYHAHLRPPLVAFSMCGCSPSILVLSPRVWCVTSSVSLPSHSSWFEHPNYILWSLQMMRLLIVQSSPKFSCYLVPLRFSIIFPNTFSLYSCLSMKKQVSQPI